MSKQSNLVNASQDITVDSSGNVGIGTSSPNHTLDVKAATGDGISITPTAGGATNYLSWYDTGGGPYGRIGYNHSAIAMTFTTVTSERMRIDSSGNLLVGRTSQIHGGKLCIDYTNGATAGMAIKDTLSSGTGVVLQVVNGSGTIVGSITQNQSATAYNTSSDYRLKTDAQPMTGASARVQALNPVNFEWIADGTRVDGFLAHEAQAVVPEAVHGTKDAMMDEEYEVTPAVLDDDGNVVTEAVMGTRSVPDYQGIDQSKLVPLLTAALQEALTEISDLKARVTALEAM